MTRTYHFPTQLARGETAEAELDAHFGTWFLITKATREQQRHGIDRIFMNKQDGVVSTVEYKTDWRAFETGNAFVETVSVNTAGKRGWAYTSRSTFLFYHLPSPACLVYILTFSRLRRNLPRWERAYPTRDIQNQGYQTRGLLVPLEEFERTAEEVCQV